MRGALVLRGFGLGRVGIIPADAGSTTNRVMTAPSRGDHPRGCGEHRQGRVQPDAAGGSSPRMRGAPTSATPTGTARRIIPADAGSTCA